MEQFEPHNIYLIGCNAGRWLSCASLFNGIPALKIIYGSPVPSDRSQACFVTFAALYTLGVKRIDKSILSFCQLINFIITNGVIFRRERSQFEEDGLSEGVLWTVVEPFMEKIVKAIRSR